jgi:hypothetical protein
LAFDLALRWPASVPPAMAAARLVGLEAWPQTLGANLGSHLALQDKATL